MSDATIESDADLKFSRLLNLMPVNFHIDCYVRLCNNEFIIYMPLNYLKRNIYFFIFNFHNIFPKSTHILIIKNINISGKYVPISNKLKYKY